MQRRDLLKLAAYSAGAMAIGRLGVAQRDSTLCYHPIIDAHIHCLIPRDPVASLARKG